MNTQVREDCDVAWYILVQTGRNDRVSHIFGVFTLQN